MINSINTLEFLKPKLITMDKFNTTTTTRILPPPSSLAQTRTFVTFTHHNADPQQQMKQQNLITDEVQQHQQHLQQERVKVQHLENHTKLQNNNCWNNFRTLYQLSASSGDRDIEMKRTIRENTIRATTNDDNEELDVEHFTTSITNIQQHTSAFNLDINNKKNYYNIKSIYGNIKESSTEANNNNNTIVNNFDSKHYCGHINNQTPFLLMTPQRTKDQDHAYRHIESVHNYAKLKSYEDDLESPNESRHSSYLDDDDDEDDDDDDADENDEEDENDIVYDDRLNHVDSPLDNDLDADYEVIFNRRRLQKSSTSSDGALTSNANRADDIKKPLQLMNALKVKEIQTAKDNGEDDDNDDLHIDVDVETVDTQTSSIAAAINPVAVNNHVVDSSPVKPDHHARRPMNAFLIFCKRHRAIVKERYKNLENRAITKILGDWWASLDAEDKKCFTTLAQLNKDAFFSANPNFKWYKLPAPPLRTLTTRPANVTGQEYDDNEANTAAAAIETISNNTRSSISNSNYFKLADEAQMGDLSQLMQHKSKTSTKLCAALQQALGETSQFMSAHITGNVEILENKQLKRRFDNENSFSSNSSEEDALQPSKKSARTCKGKRYQELINSGQIATAVKKSKSSLRLLVAGDNMDLDVKQSLTNLSNNNNIICQKRSVSESEHLMAFDITSFDLEERIKDLPALNLDDYLQRKRNTKTKKKFASGCKKRGKTSSNVNNCSFNNNNTSQTGKNQITYDNTINRNIMQLQQKQAAAVGSQKRKARKESITRRDVSAIEQEVASLLPLTFNGCCYFQEAPPKQPALTYIGPMEKDRKLMQNTITTPTTLNLTSPIIPSQNSSLTSSSAVDILSNTNNNNLNDNIASSTSDLLILAEVAANRTELKH